MSLPLNAFQSAAATEAANAARNGALAARAAADAKRDHSSQVKALVRELELAQDALRETERLQLEDKRSTEDVQKAKERLALEQNKLNDAYADNVAKMQAHLAAAQTDAQTTRSLLNAQLEVARVEEQRARQRGDEYGARQALIKQKEIEIQIMQAEIEATKAIAQAKIAETNAVREQLQAIGPLTDAKRIELDATLRAAEAQIRVAEAHGKGVELQKELLHQIRMGVGGLDDFSRAAGRAGDASHKAAGGIAGDWGGVASSINTASQALQDYQKRMQDKYGRPGDGQKGLFEEGRKSTRGEDLGKGVEEIGTGGYQFRNKDGMTSDSNGNVQQQFVWTRTSIIDYLKQAGLAQELAERLSSDFADANGNVGYKASAAQLQWGGKYSTLAEALGKMAEYYKYGDGKQEAAQMLEFERGRNQGGGTGATGAPQGRSGAATASGSGVSAGASAGGTAYVSNITIGGQRTSLGFADRGSQQAAEQLLRQLAQAKGASI
ncbi:MAG: hypothetical protein JSR53_00345 [Proteobacteria bacterium]|nr:hypothetical protein [Pseudomonadota bacterium]